MFQPEHFNMPSQLAERSAASAARLAGSLRANRHSILQRPLKTVGTWLVRAAERRALRELAQEGSLLSDIGLTREQALREASKPFWRR
jgi:uncharacterized protein YjiS (DUF1127 family)